MIFIRYIVWWAPIMTTLIYNQHDSNMPDSWAIGVAILVYGKEDHADLNNYRPITLLTIYMKYGIL